MTAVIKLPYINTGAVSPLPSFTYKCAADDHADCHIHYISPQNKLFKFLHESAFLAHFPLPSSYGMMVEPRCSQNHASMIVSLVYVHGRTVLFHNSIHPLKPQ